MYKRFLLCLLVLFLLAAVFPIPPANAVFQEPAAEVTVASLYPLRIKDSLRQASYEEAVLEVREHLKNMHTAFTVTLLTELPPELENNQQQVKDYAKQLYKDLINDAMAHTGVPDEGDYILRSTFNGAGGTLNIGIGNDKLKLTIDYQLLYRTTPAQEAVLAARIDQLLTQLDLDGKTDFEKLNAIYGYMTENIYYDYEGLEDPSDELKFTAYGALMENSAVCQGYASLLYRLCLECGIDCRIIPGLGNGGPHGWNIVRLDGLYYNVDVTWDAAWRQADLAYEFYLRCQENFGDHVRDAEFDTDAFQSAYPMSQQDYTPKPSHIHAYTEQSLQHMFAPATCTAPAQYYYSCSCGQPGSSIFSYGEALGHTEVIDRAVAATCTTTGLTEGKHCSVCQEVLVAQKATDSLGHTYENGACIRCYATAPDAVILGDLDGNHVVNILDVMSIINYITGALDFSDSQKLSADMNRDGFINILDAMALINRITGA